MYVNKCNLDQKMILKKLNSCGVSNLLLNELSEDDIMVILATDNEISDSVDNHWLYVDNAYCIHFTTQNMKVSITKVKLSLSQEEI